MRKIPFICHEANYHQVDLMNHRVRTFSRTYRYHNQTPFFFIAPFRSMEQVQS